MGLYLPICLFFVVLVLCLPMILQPYMVAEAYWLYQMHHLPLIRREIHLGSPKPTDVPPPEGPDRPPPGSTSRKLRPYAKNFVAAWGTAKVGRGHTYAPLQSRWAFIGPPARKHPT